MIKRCTVITEKTSPQTFVCAARHIVVCSFDRKQTNKRKQKQTKNKTKTAKSSGTALLTSWVNHGWGYEVVGL